MKKLAMLMAFALAAMAFDFPITVDLIGALGRTVYPDSAFCTVIAGGDTILPWTTMDTVGRSPSYDFDFPESLWFATAIVAAFWEDTLHDTTAFTIPFALNPDLARARIEDTLGAAHGSGSWEAKAIMPFLLTMSEEEFIASFGDEPSQPIFVYRGDTKNIDFTVLGATGDTIDLSGAIAVFTARSGESNSSAVICDTLAIIDAAAGRARLSLSPDETTIEPRNYAADIQLELPDGTVATIWRNRLIVRWDVTR